MSLFTSSKPITPQAQICLDQLRQLLTLCQLNGLQVHIAQLYSCGDKKSIIVMDGVEIREDKNEKLVE